jgi:hypothetical protein
VPATRPSIAWLLFVASVVLASLFASFAWMLSWYVAGMLALLLVMIGAGVGVLTFASRTLRSFALVGVGLLVGNWALVQMAAMMTIWSMGRFAP